MPEAGGEGVGGGRAAWVCRGGARALPQALRGPAPRGIGPAASDGPAGGSVPLGSLAVGANALRQGEAGPRALREGGAGVGSAAPSSGRPPFRAPRPPRGCYSGSSGRTRLRRAARSGHAPGFVSGEAEGTAERGKAAGRRGHPAA